MIRANEREQATMTMSDIQKDIQMRTNGSRCGATIKMSTDKVRSTDEQRSVDDDDRPAVLATKMPRNVI